MDAYPTPSKRKAVAVEDEQRAEVSYRKPQSGGKISRRQARFQKKVLAAVNGVVPAGCYRVERSVTLQQKTVGAASVYSNCDAGTRLDLFTPGHFKDALEVLYGTKPVTSGGFDTRTGEIYDIDVPITVVSSKALLHFKNNSQRVTIVEMYQFKAKERARDYPHVLMGYTQENWIDAPTGAGRNLQTIMNTANPTWNIKDNPVILQDYEVTLTKLRFDPGEKFTHKIVGAFGKIDLMKKIQPGQTPGATCPLEGVYRQGCGQTLVFRVYNEPSLVVGTTGTVTNQNTSLFSTIIEPPHSNSSSRITGVQVEITTEIKVKPIEGSTEVAGVRERPMMYSHSFIPAIPTGTLTYTDVDHAAPQDLGTSQF